MLKRLRRRRLQHHAAPGLITGKARVDKRTKDLVVRLQPGEIAVIDHEDIDRVSAESLVQRKVKAVVNASRSSTGRYPNLGPLLLCTAGLHVVDEAGSGVMDIPEGERIVIDGDHVYRENGVGRVEVGRGKVLTLEGAERTLDEAKTSISAELERFAENTIEYIKDERDVLLEAARLPDVDTDFHGRHVLIVVRGYDYKEDLAALHSYIREVRPVLVGVDGGADAIIEAGLKPHMIIGDMDSVTTEALLSGAELVVHAYSGGLAPGLERIQALGLPAKIFEGTGTSEDIAMLLAFERAAELIVAVGTHANLVEFLDKGRKGMASTFLVRLRVGPILVDAKGVGRLYKGRVRRSDLMLFIFAALITMGIALSVADAWRLDLSIFWQQIKDWVFSVREALFH
ncbi:MAG: hypothetical protein QOG54_674 [Actinomycetota bacterium]|jgi:uncharacterized membrane-anchored protein|nr:hypothetical protein [Actinomycetota bacterium]